MKYTDYLATHDYDRLPASVRAEIGRKHYEEQRRLVTGWTGAEGLPPALAAAYRRERPLRVANRRWPLAAAAGWLLFLLAGLGWLLRPERMVTETEVVTVERTVAGPERIVYDTVYRETTRERLVVRHDTVRITVPGPALVRVDTVYYGGEESRSLADRPGLLDLLSDE